MAEIARSHVGGSVWLVPTVALDRREPVAELAGLVEASVDEGERRLVIDLSHVTAVGSGLLELLLDTQRELSGLGGRFEVARPNAAVRDVLRATRLDRRIPILDEPLATQSTELGTTGLRIGELLVARGLVSEEQIATALELQKTSGRRVVELLVEKGWIDERDLLEALGDQLGIPSLWLRPGVYDTEVAFKVPAEVAQRLAVLPLFQVRDVLYVATADPQSLPSLERVEELVECQVVPVLARSVEIRECLAVLRAGGEDLSSCVGELEGGLVGLDEAGGAAELEVAASDSPVVKLIDAVLHRAVRDRASDIHFEPSRRGSRVRLRIDGALYTIMRPPAEAHPALVSRLKVMANLDIAERRLPQDGRLQVTAEGRTIDLRFSSLPGIFGEKVVLRVLDKAHAVLELSRLGLSSHNLETFGALLGKSCGLVLVTGPTGSGKSTTLYAALDQLDDEERNLVTIEDPVEYQIDSINQIQVRDAVGLSFARVLKHVLRQDPDVIMVGEIREQETAGIAVEAALTGHLVLSTLHTNDAIGTITRLLDMGVEPFLLSSAFQGVVAQRLVRTVCPECATTERVPAETLRAYGVAAQGSLRLARGRGCGSCYESGYKGRRAIHEVLAVDDELQHLIASNPSRRDLQSYVAKAGLRTLLDDGMQRVLEGDTTPDEVLRVVNS